MMNERVEQILHFSLLKLAAYNRELSRRRRVWRNLRDALIEVMFYFADKPQAYEQQRLVAIITSIGVESTLTRLSMEEVEELLLHGVNPSAVDFLNAFDILSFNGRRLIPDTYFASPLYHAVTEHLTYTTELLLVYNANPNSWNRAYGTYFVLPKTEMDQPVWMTPAHGAVCFGSYKCLQTLIQHGADVNARIQAIDGVITEDVGYTPLHIAAKGRILGCMKLLLDHGADLCATDAKGQTSLYVAAKHDNGGVVMTLLDSSASNASLLIPTLENDTVLHECLRGGRIVMTESIKELVRRGADVCLHNCVHESPVDLAVQYKWSRDIVELLILQGHGMDFDRQRCTACSPLDRAVFRPRPLRPGTLVVRYKHKSVSYADWDDSLALLFLQMGASRESLEALLFFELNREEAGSRLLHTLMDSFAYLPSLSQLEHSFSTSTLRRMQRNRDRLYFSIPTELASYAEAVHRTEHAQKLFLATRILRRRGLPTDNISVSYLSRKKAAPASLVQKKKEEYCQRRREVPSLAHLCRSTVRHILKADVRQVVSYPIPTCVKEYILLDYPLGPQDQEGGEKKSLPSSSSSERGHPQVSTS